MDDYEADAKVGLAFFKCFTLADKKGKSACG